MNFQKIWENIKTHEGEVFKTKRNLPFTYTVEGNYVIPSRTDYPLHKTQFVKALEVDNLTGPGKINKIVRGPAYVYGILKDPRIRG
ncbi:MAG: hypothetical protein BWX78_00999 [Firmicutes bacterium ADurb.Bin099]|mgnify:CR=1 FL=1|jgi:hypothetical protein|nr:MAG: hypothetical protein BWX78_00999 [Firmicutes bacterium ADurb.Bin099]HPY98623.1 hypothetical protein [Clostridia bacterium]HQC68727.1 hypothetical protein [Clostridia bacterium]